MTPLTFFMACLAGGVLAGTQLVLRGQVEDAIIGLNVAVICTVTALVLLNEYSGLAFSRDIAFFLILPGIFGSIFYARMIRARALK